MNGQQQAGEKETPPLSGRQRRPLTTGSRYGEGRQNGCRQGETPGSDGERMGASLGQANEDRGAGDGEDADAQADVGASVALLC